LEKIDVAAPFFFAAQPLEFQSFFDPDDAGLSVRIVRSVSPHEWGVGAQRRRTVAAGASRAKRRSNHHEQSQQSQEEDGYSRNVVV
jgi:hypothetical protein